MMKSGHPSKRVFSKLILLPQDIAASFSILRTEGKVAADWSAPQLKTKEELSVLEKSHSLIGHKMRGGGPCRLLRSGEGEL